jgi:hypothetical protein
MTLHVSLDPVPESAIFSTSGALGGPTKEFAMRWSVPFDVVLLVDGASAGGGFDIAVVGVGVGVPSDDVSLNVSSGLLVGAVGLDGQL